MQLTIAKLKRFDALKYNFIFQVWYKMFAILRRHQKSLFIVVAILVVISFAFFGVMDIFVRQNHAESRTVCKSLTKRPIKEEEVLALTHLLTHSPYVGGKELSFLHDGVIERDFLSSGLGAFLAEQYKEELREEVEERIEKLQTFSLYEHPTNPIISLTSLWKRMVPNLLLQLQELKRQKGEEAYQFSYLADLYVQALHCPPERTRRVLLAEQEKLHAQHDPTLMHAQLSPGGFSSYADWFGSKWLHLISQCVINAAHIAEKKGIKVSWREAQQNLYRLFSFQLAQLQQTVERDRLVHAFQTACAQLGLHEQLLIESWRKVLLFRKLLESIADGVLLEALPFAQFSAVANERARVELYSLPDLLPFSDLLGLARWQIYAEIITGSDPQAVVLHPIPHLLSQKASPSLFVRTYDITYAEVPRESVSSRFSLKEMWQWASEDAHWEEVVSQFPELGAKSARTPQDRFRVLVACNSSARIPIDKAIQRAMLETSGAIERALDVVPKKTTTLVLGEETSIHPFSGTVDSRILIDLLEQKKPETLGCFTFDGDVYYRIEVEPIESHNRLLHFHEAELLLDRWLEQRLEAAYPNLRKSHPLQFRTASGTERPIKEIKEELVRFVYAPLLKQIEGEYECLYGILPGNSLQLPSHFYARNYALSSMRVARDALSEQQESTLLLKRESVDLQRKEGKLYQEGMRADSSWSHIVYDSTKGLVFFRVFEKSPGEQEIHKGARLVQKTLQSEAKREWAKTLIEEMGKHGAIVVF